MIIWTDSPKDAVWQHLNYFSSKNNVENAIRGRRTSQAYSRSDEKTVKVKATLAAASIRQACHLQQHLDPLEFSVRPLAQYYICHLLAKAAAAIRGIDIPIEYLAGHGLTMTQPSMGYVPSEKIPPFFLGDCKCEERPKKTGAGIFQALCRVLGCQEMPIKRLSLKQVFGTCVELSELYAKTYRNSRTCFPVTDSANMQLERNITPSLTYSPGDEVPWSNIELAAVIRQYFSRTESKNHVVTISLKNELAKVNRLFVRSSIGRWYLVRPLPTGVTHPLVVGYVGMYLLSNLVRYSPVEWVHSVNQDRDGEFVLVRAFCAVMERSFLQGICEFLYEETFTVCPTGS